MRDLHPFAFGGARHRRSLELRETVVALFGPTRDAALAHISEFTETEWRRNLLWLDASGLALYLIHELDQLNRTDLLPPFLVARLCQNLDDNRKRTAWLFDEAMALNNDFRRLGLCFAHLKGFALGPESVPDATLRNQLDLDFAVKAEDAPRAAEVLRTYGYELHAVEKTTWEFKAGSSSMPHIGDLYKPRPQRSVELHLASGLPSVGEQSNLLLRQLERAQMRTIRGRMLPALSPEDVFLNQCTHLFGHFRSSFTRSSWGLELARHIRARHADTAFWQQVAELAECSSSIRAIALSLIPVEDIYRVSAPLPFRSWAADSLSASLILWAHRYGRSALLSDYPGTKFHLLLEDLLQPVNTSPRQTSARLVPRRLPTMITVAPPNETLRQRLMRYRVQLGFLRFRTRFHIEQGLRFLVEKRRWRTLTGCKGMTFSQPAHDNHTVSRS